MKKSILLCLILIAMVACNNSKDQEKPPMANQLPDPLEAGWEGESVCEVLEENTTIRVLKCTFPPGVGHERHHHNPHVGYTLVGGRFQMTDSTGTREVNVPTGSTFRNDKVIVHEVLNIGKTTAEFLIIEYK